VKFNSCQLPPDSPCRHRARARALAAQLHRDDGDMALLTCDVIDSRSKLPWYEHTYILVYYIISIYIVLYCAIFYSILLYYINLNYIKLHEFILNYIILH